MGIAKTKGAGVNLARLHGNARTARPEGLLARTLAFCLACTFCPLPSPCRNAMPAAVGESSVQAAATDGRWALVVAGISGDPSLRDSYLALISDLRDILEGTFGFAPDHVRVLFEDPGLDPRHTALKSTRENLVKVCRDLAGRAKPGDTAFVLVMGHGSYDKDGYKLNLVGPDPSGDDLAECIYSIPAGRFIVVNTTSCSGGSIAALTRHNTVLVTSTRSGSEKNLTHMAGFFVDALKNNNADLDKNGRISLLEAFNYAARRVEEYYEKEGLLQTEHPVLEDDGDGAAHPDPGPVNGEGLLARTTFLDSGAPAVGLGGAGPEDKSLAAEADALEQEIEKLKYQKAALPPEEYEKRLEELLIRLAEIHAKLRKK
jgi:hypothetical protein